MDDNSLFRIYCERMSMEKLVKQHAELSNDVKCSKLLAHMPDWPRLEIIERVMILREMVFEFTLDDNVFDYDMSKGRGLVHLSESGSVDSSPVTTVFASKLITRAGIDFYQDWLKSLCVSKEQSR